MTAAGGAQAAHGPNLFFNGYQTSPGGAVLCHTEHHELVHSRYNLGSRIKCLLFPGNRCRAVVDHLGGQVTTRSRPDRRSQGFEPEGAAPRRRRPPQTDAGATSGCASLAHDPSCRSRLDTRAGTALTDLLSRPVGSNTACRADAKSSRRCHASRALRQSAQGPVKHDSIESDIAKRSGGAGVIPTSTRAASSAR